MKKAAKRSCLGEADHLVGDSDPENRWGKGRGKSAGGWGCTVSKSCTEITSEQRLGVGEPFGDLEEKCSGR